MLFLHLSYRIIIVWSALNICTKMLLITQHRYNYTFIILPFYNHIKKYISKNCASIYYYKIQESAHAFSEIRDFM